MSMKRFGNIGIAVLVFASGVWIYLQASGFPVASAGGAPGPARLPSIYAVLLCIAGAALAIGAWRSSPEAAAQAPKKDRHPARAIILILATLGYVFVLPLLGFLLTSMVWFAGVVFYLQRSWVASAIGALVFVPAVYTLFHLLLSVPLP